MRMKYETLLTCVISCLLAAVTISPRPAEAQVLYGSLVGAVQDDSGAAVPGAGVTIVNNSTARSHETKASDDGTYSFTDLAPGVYTLSVSAKGFRTSRTNNVEVSINAVARQDLKLQVGELAETVTVEASAAALQTDTADVHVALASQQITELP